ncbi:MAG: PorV/PorQ family protein [bacterium]
MMKKFSLLLLIPVCIACIICGTASLTASGPGSTAFNFLKIGPGPRAIGMGGAYTAVADDVTATYWNPAGLTQLNRYEASFMQAQWFEDISYNYLGLAKSSKNLGAVGFSLYRLSKNDIQGYDSGGASTGKLEFADTAAALSFSYPFTIGSCNSSAGITTKYLHEKLADTTATGIAFDIGFLTAAKLYQVLPVKAALTLKNMGADIQFAHESESLPQLYTLGLSSLFLHETLLVGLDYSFPKDNDNYASIGSEYSLYDLIKIRAGYRSEFNSSNDDEDHGVRFGFGLGNTDLHLDYAFVPYGNLGTTHRFGITARFGAQHQTDQYQKRIDNHLKRANNYFVSKDLITAHKEVSLVLKLDPAHREGRMLLDQITRQSNSINLERHLTYADKLIKNNKLMDAKLECEHILAIYPANEQAVQYMKLIEEKLASEKKNRIEILIKQGDDFFVQESYQDAIEIWEKVLLIDPQNTQAAEKVTKAQEKLALQNLQEKQSYLNQLFSKAKKSYAQEDWKKSVKLLSEIVTQDPVYPDAKLMLNTAQDKLTVIQKAESEKYLQEGINYYRTEDIEKAYASFQAALKTYPENTKAEQYLLKVKALRTVLNEQKSQKFNQQGLTAYANGDMKQAIAFFEQALEIRPDYEEAKKNLNRVKKEINP